MVIDEDYFIKYLKNELTEEETEILRKLHRNFFRLVSSVAHKHTLAVRHLLRLLCKIFIRDNLFPERRN